MKPLFASHRPAPHTLRVLAHVLRYPDAALRAHVPEMQQALKSEAALAPMRLAELGALLRHLERSPALDVESEYVELFDRGRRTALHLFEHVHGDSRDRGPAMIDLAQTFEAPNGEQGVALVKQGPAPSRWMLLSSRRLKASRAPRSTCASALSASTMPTMANRKRFISTPMATSPLPWSSRI